MTSLKISYGNLAGISNSCRGAAEELNDYSDSMKSGIAKKISNLNSSSYMQAALNQTNNKIQSLRDKSESLNSFADKIEKFKSHVKEVDNSVSNRIGEVTTNFKNKNDIDISCVSEFFQWLNTDVLNSSDVCRWIKDQFNKVEESFDGLMTSVKDWYRTGGGKYLVSIAITVAVVIGAIVCAIGASGFFAVFAIAAAVFAIANGITKTIYNVRAYNENGKDPAWANRYGKVDKVSKALKFETNNKFCDYFAKGLDTVEFVATVGALCSDISSLSRNVVNFGKGKGFVSLKELFGGTNLSSANRGAGIVGSRFMERIGGQWKATPKTIFNGLKSLATDGHFRNQIGNSLGKFKTEVIDMGRYARVTTTQGSQVIKGLFSSDSNISVRSREVFTNFLSTDVKSGFQWGLNHMKTGLTADLNKNEVTTFVQRNPFGSAATNTMANIYKATSAFRVYDNFTGGDINKSYTSTGQDVLRFTGLPEFSKLKKGFDDSLTTFKAAFN